MGEHILAAGLGRTDAAIVAVAVLLLFVISWIFGRREKDTNDYFLGGRRIPAVIACLSPRWGDHATNHRPPGAQPLANPARPWRAGIVARWLIDRNPSPTSDIGHRISCS